MYSSCTEVEAKVTDGLLKSAVAVRAQKLEIVEEERESVGETLSDTVCGNICEVAAR